MNPAPLRGIPIRDYMPADLGGDAYGAVSRVLDEIRADRARRLLDERRTAVVIDAREQRAADGDT